MSSGYLKEKTKSFAKKIVFLCRELPNNPEGWIIGKQLLRSGTSVAANYRAACRGRSKKEFIAKLGIVEEETDEAIFWLELTQEVNLISSSDIDLLTKEANAILSMVVASVKTARKNNII